MVGRWAWTMPVVAGLLVGCGTPLGPCFSELIEVSFAGTIDGAAGSAAGQVAPGNISGFPELRQLVIDGRPRPGERVIWTIDGVAGGFLAIDLPATVAAGQTLPVASVVQGGGWGLVPGGSGGAVVGARVDGVFATTGSGTVTVLGTAPFRVRADLTLSTPARTVRIQGDMTFSYRREPGPCT